MGSVQPWEKHWLNKKTQKQTCIAGNVTCIATEACMTGNGTCVAARVGKTGTAGIETCTPTLTDETEVEAKEG